MSGVGKEIDRLGSMWAEEQKKKKEEHASLTPYTKIFELSQKINFGPCNTKVDVKHYSVNKELVVNVYPPQWVDNKSCIKHLIVSELVGNMVMLNQIAVIENYLQGVLDESTGNKTN